MGEPEAGSEFAIGAAAAGEARRLGFGVIRCHPRGTGRIWTRRTIIRFLTPIPFPFSSHRGPEAEECPWQQRVNAPFGTRVIVLWGRSIGSGGGCWKHLTREGGRTVWSMSWVGRPPGPPTSCGSFAKPQPP